jgi:argininosuccinate lyase
MAKKLWEKGYEINKEIETFTIGHDREMDLYLAKYDVLGSMAHITMLESIGLLTKDELSQLLSELKNIYRICERGEFKIEEGRGGCPLTGRAHADPPTRRHGQENSFRAKP